MRGSLGLLRGLGALGQRAIDYQPPVGAGPVPITERELEAASGPVEDVAFRGAGQARPAREALEAIGEARAVIVGPSNPVISIGPILAVPGMRELLAGAGAPVVAVSPFVAGEVIKGPTDKFMRAIGQQPRTSLAMMVRPTTARNARTTCSTSGSSGM